jgi:hypothetical protein
MIKRPPIGQGARRPEPPKTPIDITPKPDKETAMDPAPADTQRREAPCP